MAQGARHPQQSRADSRGPIPVAVSRETPIPAVRNCAVSSRQAVHRRHRCAAPLAGCLGFAATRRPFSLYSARSSTRFSGVGHGRDDDDIILAVQHRQGDRLHPGPQHADRHRLVHAAASSPATPPGTACATSSSASRRRRPARARCCRAACRSPTTSLVIVVVVALTFLMWLMLRETFGAKRHLRERLDHLPALCVPRHLVDRLRLRLLVEPDLRRGGDAHGPRRPAGGRARRQRRRRGAARCGARPARQRRDLVRQPDGARGDERRQLRHALGRRPRPALQCAARRARFRSPPCATA